MTELLELPEAFRGLGYDRFAQRGARVVYHYPDDRDTEPRLRRWTSEGIEFADAEIAVTADYRRNTFGLHFFETWEQAEAWLRVDGTHEPWADCIDCREARETHEMVWAEHNI